MAGDSVKVAVRCRPFNQREKNASSECVISITGNVTSIVNPENGESRSFAFDHSYWSHNGFKESEDGLYIADSPESIYSDQRQVFSDLGQGVLDNAWQGYNAALFAYGQTGSGKSYSMIGYGANKGIVPITCNELFLAIERNDDKTKQFQVSFSMLEIYNEQVRDLLSSTVQQQQKGGLRVRQNPKSGFYVEGLKNVPVQGYAQIEKLMEQGTLHRTTASTNMNATSSRSHMVIAITFKQVYKNELGQSTTKSSEINLVDLAGSERAGSTGATGDRLKEGSAINQSLSTLGKVISALADQAMGKKKILVPYRDSVLTKLLQSALGGNSRTIMIAALSPAAMNYDETLSTLRYADRAKRIQNKATVNESPTDKLIRELKEENAKLMTQLQQLNVGGKGMNLEDLQDLLAHNEAQMSDLDVSWEQKLEEARRDWERSQKEQEANEMVEWRQHPYLQNVNEDPQLSGVIKLCITGDQTVIGKPGNKGVTMELRGLGILGRHAILKKKADSIYIEPGTKGAVVVVNGKPLKNKQTLKHLDRIKLGSNSLYLYVGFPSERRNNDRLDDYSYDFFQTELADEAGFNQEFLKSQESEDHAIDTATLLVFQDYINLLPRVYEANAMSEEMKKGVSFEAEIRNLATHDSLGRPKSKQITVKVVNHMTKTVWVWSKEKFINRKFMIQDLYQKYSEGDSHEVDKNKDPFWDPLEDYYIGSCHVWLNNVAYCLDSDDHLEVRNHHGKEEGQIRVKLVPCDAKGKQFKDEMIVFDPRELIGKRLDFMVEIPQCFSLKWVMDDNSRGVYFGFNFYDHPKVIKSDTVHHSVNPKIKFKKHFTIQKVTDDFLDYLQTHALVIELWGTQGGSSNEQGMGNGCQVEMVDDEKEDQANLVNELKAKLKQQEEELSELKRVKVRERRDSHKPPGDHSQSAIHGGYMSSRHRSGSIGLNPIDIDTNECHSDNKTFSRMLSVPEGDDVEKKRKSPAHSKPNTPQRAEAGQSLDADIAKALKVFFRDVRGVQKKLQGVKNTGLEVTNSADNGHNLNDILEKQVSHITDLDGELGTCVGALRETMLKIIKRKKDGQA